MPNNAERSNARQTKAFVDPSDHQYFGVSPDRLGMGTARGYPPSAGQLVEPVYPRLDWLATDKRSITPRSCTDCGTLGARPIDGPLAIVPLGAVARSSTPPQRSGGTARV